MTFGTVEKQVYFDKVTCECGMAFTGGKDYTALESWKTHADIYTSHGYPREEHDTYQTGTGSVTRYEATKTCTCGWHPVDDTPVYLTAEKRSRHKQLLDFSLSSAPKDI